MQAVLASPINGQFYVIGNPSDVLGNVGQRTIAPRYKVILKNNAFTFDHHVELDRSLWTKFRAKITRRTR